MTLRDDMATDMAETVFNTSDFAETVTYTPAGGTASSINVLWMGQDRDVPMGISEMDETPVQQAIVTIPCTDSGIASPARGDTIRYDGADWAVVQVQRMEVGIKATLMVQRSIGTTRMAERGHYKRLSEI
jgi:hypothetical protein